MYIRAHFLLIRAWSSLQRVQNDMVWRVECLFHRLTFIRPAFLNKVYRSSPPFFCPRPRSALLALRFSYSPRCAPLESVRGVCWQWDRNWLATTKRLPEDLVCATTPKNMQQGVQHITSNNVGSCWPTMLRPFARSFSLFFFNKLLLNTFNSALAHPFVLLLFTVLLEN